MRESGAVAEWDDERGFGFVAPDDGGRRLFVHVSAFPRGQRPRLGDRLTFTRGEDERGRPRALEVHLDRPRTPTRGLRPALAGAVAFLALLALLSALGRLPVWAAPVCLALSALTLLVYRTDKEAAQHGDRRVPESTLLLLGLLGGWPGALVARPLFRHKTTKQPFRTEFWASVALSCAAVVAVAAVDLGT